LVPPFPEEQREGTGLRSDAKMQGACDRWTLVRHRHPLSSAGVPLQRRERTIVRLLAIAARDRQCEIGIVTDIGSAAVGLALLLAGAVWLLAIARRLGECR
jgi:hypothetical protein